MAKLLFIDTNIYLDFYRIRNEVKVSFLKHLEAIRNSLIITDQVEMEFKKNRQSAILEGMKELKPPTKINLPGVLQKDKSATALKKDYQRIDGRIKKLKARLDNVFENPVRYDKVYQVLQRLFSKKQSIDLYRKHKKRYEVRELAEKSGLPLEFITAARQLLNDIDLNRFACPVLPIDRQLVPPWKTATDFGF